MNQFCGRLLLTAVFAVTFAAPARAALMTFPGGDYNVIYDSANLDVTFQTQYFDWGTGYNDLPNVIWTVPFGSIIIDFQPLFGAQVTLNSFDLGSYFRFGQATKYQVYDLSDLVTPTIDSGVLTVPYDPNSHPTYAINQSSFVGLRLVVGPDANNIGLNNVVYNSTNSAVPEPGSLTLVGLGVVGLVIGAYRRRQLPQQVEV